MTLSEGLQLAILVVLVVGFAGVWVAARHLERTINSLGHEVRELRLTSRTRITTASVRSGAPSEVEILKRLGRASASRRIVVGGDDDSEQKQARQRPFVGMGVDDE